MDQSIQHIFKKQKGGNNPAETEEALNKLKTQVQSALEALDQWQPKQNGGALFAPYASFCDMNPTQCGATSACPSQIGGSKRKTKK